MVEPKEDPLALTESHLGRVLAIIHRVLPRLEDARFGADVQKALAQAGDFLKAASLACQDLHKSRQLAISAARQAQVEAEIVAVIAAAISAVLDSPYRLISVQPVIAPVPHLNVWALEGRTQIFQSHKIR
jgi:hypothetical protein